MADSQQPKRLRCTIIGSFRFKCEIDEAISAFRDLSVDVLAPASGGIILPRKGGVVSPRRDGQFYPLPDEQGMTPHQVELSFIECIKQSDFVYLINVDGYVGSVVALELGVVFALSLPLYARERLSRLLDFRPGQRALLEEHMIVAPYEEVVRLEQAKRDLNAHQPENLCALIN